MHKNFSFKGMVRSNDNILSNEGECLELVNLRMVNGSLRAVPETVVKAVLPVRYSKIYWHDKAACHICVESNAPYGVGFYDSEWNALLDDKGEKLEFPMLEDVTSVEFMDYVAICMTGKGIRYLLFCDGSYRWLGEAPPVPELSVTLSSKLYNITTETAFTSSRVDTSIASTWGYNSRGYYDECISKANKSGYYVDRALFRFALRLYDGSYIYSSHIIYADDDSELNGVTRDAGNLQSSAIDETVVESRYEVKLLAFKPEFEFLNLDLKNWDGIIVGIDIFTTGSIMGKKIATATTTLIDSDSKQNSTEKYEVYKSKGLEELWDEINNASLFYKIAEYDIYGNLQTVVEDVSQVNIVLQDALSGFEQKTSYSSIVAGCSYMFNNRLHVASLREYFFKGYGCNSLFPVGAESAVADNVTVVTKIKTQNGVTVVANSFDNVKVGCKNDVLQFTPLLMYPDVRAFEMSLYVVLGNATYMKCFQLTPHKFLNQSQYLHKWYMGYEVTVTSAFASGKTPAAVSKEDVLAIFNEQIGVHEVIYSSAKGCWTYKGAAFPPEEYSTLRVFQIPRDVADGDKIVFSIKAGTSDSTFRDINNIPLDDTWQMVESVECNESNIFEERESLIKVSMVDNPFVFPAKCTYSLSQGKVMALSTNRMAMSEGQFGEHPLYVFSKGGIQVMAVDTSGTVAYSNVFPVSHEICRNADSVCGTDSGVVFLGEQGVMLIGGSRCVRLSVDMDNDCKELETIERSGVIGMIASLHGLDDAIDTTHFMDFMSTSMAMRLPETNEIVFCNMNYNYCFLYSVVGSTWSKIGNAFVGFVKSSTQFCMFAHDGNNTCIHVPGNSVSGKNRVLLVTRSFLFGTKLPKRITQLMLHAYLSKPDEYMASMPFLSCFLLGSNDGVHFKAVSGCDRKGEAQDVVFPYFPTPSYRYYVFALTGELNSSSMITGLEMDVSAAWHNRLK